MIVHNSIYHLHLKSNMQKSRIRSRNGLSNVIYRDTVIADLFSNFQFILPNTTKYSNKFDKKIPQEKTERYFGGGVQYYI